MNQSLWANAKALIITTAIAKALTLVIRLPTEPFIRPPIIKNKPAPNSVSATNNQTVCYGGSYSIGGNTYNSTGVYTDVLTAANGCDSTVTTNLTVLSQFTVSATALTSSTIWLK